MQHRERLVMATVGDNCIDHYLPPVACALVGGNAVNVAVQLSRLGRPVAFFGAVGSDPEGDAVRSALRRNGVDVAGLLTDGKEPTAATTIAIGEGGERRFVSESFGASAAYRPPAQDLARLCAMAHVHIGWLRGVAKLKHNLVSAGVRVSQDLSVNNEPAELRPEGLDLAFLSAPAAAAAEAAQRLLAQGARLAVVTMGAAGSLAASGGTLVRLSAPAIAPRDTTGAGDAFIAGFLHAWQTAPDLRQALAAATACAAAACLHEGGFPQAPVRGLGARPNLTGK